MKIKQAKAGALQEKVIFLKKCLDLNRDDCFYMEMLSPPLADS